MRYLSKFQNDKNKKELFEFILDVFPSDKTFPIILDHYYRREPHVMMLHQLLMIGEFLSYDNEYGNKHILDFIKNFITDLELNRKTLEMFSSLKINFNAVSEMPNEYDPYNINESIFVLKISFFTKRFP